MIIFPKKITKDQSKDTGMALVLILLILGFWLKNMLLLKIAIPVLLLNMISPVLFIPFTFCWLSFSNLLGMIMSKVLLTIVFVIVVTPIALLRKVLGHDPLQIKEFKKDKSSVFKNRKQRHFSIEEIERPF